MTTLTLNFETAPTRSFGRWLLAGIIAAMTPPAAAEAATRVAVGGIDIHYEVHGSGEPLVMLHGGGTPSEFFGAPLQAMAAKRKVIAVHLQGHGLSGDDDAPWTHAKFGTQVLAVMKREGLERADIIGYSLGASTALRLAIDHPEKVARLVVVSAAISSEDYHPEVSAAFKQLPANAPGIAANIAPTPMGKLYPDRDWQKTFTKLGHFTQTVFDWRAEVAALKVPTLWVYADADMMPPAAAISGYVLQGGGQRDAGMDGKGRTANRLAILPGRTHYDLIHAPLLAPAVVDFLESR